MGVGFFRLHRSERLAAIAREPAPPSVVAAPAATESLEELERLTAPERPVARPVAEPKKAGRK